MCVAYEKDNAPRLHAPRAVNKGGCHAQISYRALPVNSRGRRKPLPQKEFFVFA